MTDDRRETVSFKIADQKIGNLLRRLANKNVCGCCTARALMLHAAVMFDQTMGTAEAIEMFEELVSEMRAGEQTPAPERSPSTAEH